MVSFLFTNIHSHSTATLSFNIIHKFTFNDSSQLRIYIYLQLQHIFIHIQGQNFYSTLLLYSFNSLLMCWNSRIPCSFTLNDLILFHEYIHSRSKVKNFIQHCCYIYSTFYAHPSLRIPRLQPALSFGNRRPTMVIWSAPVRRYLREEIWTFNGGAQVFWNEHGKNGFESTCMTPTVWPLFLFFSLHSFALTSISLRIFHFYKRSREALWISLWWLFLYQNYHLSISMFSNMVMMVEIA